MKYETLSQAKSGSYTAGQTETFTFTFNNNISHIQCLFFKAGNNTGVGEYISSYTISNNTLTVVCTMTSNYTEYLFVLATVASY